MNIVVKDGSGEIEEKKSRFIAHVLSVGSEEDAIEIINTLKKKYWDARHNVYAYVCGNAGEISRFSDDGEPSGTAGKPVLDIINSYKLTNCLIVVTRYFGGTLLGTGGLIRAYQQSAKEGIANSKISEIMTGYLLSIRTDYNMYGKITYIASECEASVIESEFREDVLLKILIKEDIYSAFLKKIAEICSGTDCVEKSNRVTYYLNDRDEFEYSLT